MGCASPRRCGNRRSCVFHASVVLSSDSVCESPRDTMGVGLPPLEFTECMTDSPYFRENLHKHERELEKTNQQIKRIIKEVKDVLNTAKRESIPSLRDYSRPHVLPRRLRPPESYPSRVALINAFHVSKSSQFVPCSLDVYS